MFYAEELGEVYWDRMMVGVTEWEDAMVISVADDKNVVVHRIVIHKENVCRFMWYCTRCTAILSARSIKNSFKSLKKLFKK